MAPWEAGVLTCRGGARPSVSILSLSYSPHACAL